MNLPKTHLSAFAAALLLFSTSLEGRAEQMLRLPSIIGHHMVLQRDLENPVWGWAAPGATITVAFAGESYEAEADDEGRWRLRLAAMPGSHHALDMTINAGGESITLSNIVVGEVWVCSGQSNMRWSVNQSYDPDLETATANYPNIRLVTLPNVGTQEPQDDFDGQWMICTPDTVGTFSAVGYYFGRQLHQSLGVPIGLINNAWGGSAAEAWVSREVLEGDERFAEYLERWREIEASFDYEAELAKWRETAETLRAEGKQVPRAPTDQLRGQHRPGNLWAGVLHPIIGYGIRGTIWYQGESNAARAGEYHDLFSLMITEWRSAWDQGDFPFYWVQLADFRDEVEEPGESEWAELREAQTDTLALPNTGQAVIYDIGEARDIHPRDKQNVGKRLARLALAKDYGFDIVHLSPSFASMENADEGALLLTFENVGSRLYAFDTPEVRGFVLAGEDGVWHHATGEVVGNEQVKVRSEAVPEPVHVRYAWADNPVANLMSWEGLPAAPFRTDREGASEP